MSNGFTNSRDYLIMTKLLKLYSKFTGLNLVNVHTINNRWYYDKEKTKLFQVNIIINVL